MGPAPLRKRNCPELSAASHVLFVMMDAQGWLPAGRIPGPADRLGCGGQQVRSKKPAFGKNRQVLWVLGGPGLGP